MRGQMCLGFPAVAAFVVGVGAGATGSAGSAPATATSGPPPVMTKAIEAARCFVPEQWGFGFNSYSGRCAALVAAKRTGPKVWRLQLRLPPIYCVRLYLGRTTTDMRLDIPGIGSLWEVTCPSSAYPRLRAPNVRLKLGDSNGNPTTRSEGTVLLTTVDGSHTRVLIKANMDTASVYLGTCERIKGLAPFRFNPFYSFRSETTIRASLSSLLATPHALGVDAGGAHGGGPLACVDIHRS